MIEAIAAVALAVVVLALLYTRLPEGESLTGQGLRLLFFFMILYGIYAGLGIAVVAAQQSATGHDASASYNYSNYSEITNATSCDGGFAVPSTMSCLGVGAVQHNVYSVKTIYRLDNVTTSTNGTNQTIFATPVLGYLQGYNAFLYIVFGIVLLTIAYNVLLYLLKDVKMFRARRRQGFQERRRV
jgi:hypothetical protein